MERFGMRLGTAVCIMGGWRKTPSEKEIMAEISRQMTLAEVQVKGTGQLPSLNYSQIMGTLSHVYKTNDNFVDLVVAVAVFCPEKAIDWVNAAYNFVLDVDNVELNCYSALCLDIIQGSIETVDWLTRHSIAPAITDPLFVRILDLLLQVMALERKIAPPQSRSFTKSIRDCVESGGRIRIIQIRNQLPNLFLFLKPRVPNEFGEYLCNELFYAAISRMSLKERLELLASSSDGS